MEQKKSIPKPKDDRVRNIVFVLYEDSANPEWKTLLEEDHVPFMYAYHDKDKVQNGETIEDKKPHYHVILCFEGKKSPEQLQAYADRYGAANGHYEPVASLRAMARYLCHMDNPDKVQYDSSIVKTCAIDYNAIVGMAADKYKAIGEMMDFCESEGITSYYELMNYARIHRYDWFKSLCDDSTIVIKEYLKSKVWTMEQMNIDPATGEVR